MSSSLVFVDRAIANYPLLVSGIDPTATVVLLDSQQDGVAQISAVLAAQPDAPEAVHLFSHGAPGVLKLGATTLSLDSIDAYDLAPWQKALRHANLLIYGCRVAAGETGDRFLQKLHQQTGANIAATATPTGSSAKGGDWNLERRIGAIDPAAVLRSDVMAQYDDILEFAIPNLLFAAVTDEENPETPSELVIVGISPPFAGQIDRNLPPQNQPVSLPFETFALARQAETGNLYYIETERSRIQNGFTSGRVGFYNITTGENRILDNLTGVGGAGNQFVKMAQQRGTNTLFAMNSSTPNLYVISVTGGNAGVAVDLGAVSFGGGILPIGSGDIAFDPNNPNRLFATVTRPDLAGVNTFQLYVIDVSNPTAGNISASLIGNVRLPNGTELSDVGAGSLAFGQDGNLYLTSDEDGNSATTDDIFLYRIDDRTAVVEGSPIPVQLGQGQRLNDFATLPTITPRVNLVLTKDDGLASVRPGDEITYTITVTNTSATSDLANISLTDFLTGVTNITWSGRFTGGGSNDPSRFSPGAQSGTGNINVRFDLGAQATLTYTVRGTVAPNSPLGSTLSNTATVELPPGIIDPTPGNNTQTDTTRIDTVTRPDNPVDPENPGNPDGPDDRDCVQGVNRRGRRNRNNRLNGDNNINRLTGGDRNDLLRGFGCPDTLIGRRGRDTLRGGDARDILQGNQGSDRLNGGSGADRLNGGLGNDLLIGGTGNDLLRGGNGRDRLNGGEGADRMVGNGGNDRLRGNSENDVISGKLGRDRLNGNRGNDRLNGNLGNDVLFGGVGIDVVDGGRGDDFVFGGDDRDRLLGRLGLDFLVGGDGSDTLLGQAQADRLFGGNGRDRILAGGGTDLVEGGAQIDFLDGGAGIDRIRGEGGADRIIGGRKADILTGGSGGDRFEYRNIDEGGDRITDFSGGDRIDFSRIFARSGFGSSRPFRQYVRLQQSGSNTIVSLDVNGDRRGGFEQFITLAGVRSSSISARNFVV